MEDKTINLLDIVCQLSKDTNRQSLTNNTAVYLAHNPETKDYYVGSTNSVRRRLN